jgi:aminoglycoside 3-N-acetyltransferase I
MYLTNLLKRQDFHVLAATGNDQLLGGLTAYELPKYKSEVIEIFLYELGVKPEFRQKGIGKKLALELIALCKNRGIMQLFVMTTRYNIAALELFKDLGGQPDMDSIKFSFKL